LCAAETVDTESRAAEAVQHKKNSNGRVQGIAQSDEDDTEDEHDASGGDALGDSINNGNDCSDETETSWLVLLI
jgi:U3 small nucleolar RNA-associated protein 25